MAFETRDPFLIHQVYADITSIDFLSHPTAKLWNRPNISLATWQVSLAFCCKQEREDPTLTEWDHFAHREYIRLSMEEDGEDASNGSPEGWDESLEAPF